MLVLMLVMLLRSKCMHVGDASQVKVYVGVASLGMSTPGKLIFFC